MRRLFPAPGGPSGVQENYRSDPATQLFIRQSDGTLTTALLPAAFPGAALVGANAVRGGVADLRGRDRRLVRVNSLRIGSDEEERPYVSLGHDALAQVAARWQEACSRRKLRSGGGRAGRAGASLRGPVCTPVPRPAGTRTWQKNKEKSMRRAGGNPTPGRHDRFAHLFAEAQQTASGARPEWESASISVLAIECPGLTPMRSPTIGP